MSLLIPSKNKEKQTFKKFNSPKILKWWHKLLFLSPILLILFIYKGVEWYNEYQLTNNSEETWATVTRVSLGGIRDEFDSDNIEFQYVVEGETYFGYGSERVNEHFVFNKYDLPIFPNHRYRLKYVKNKPTIYKIKFEQPDIKTILSYLNDVSQIIINKEKINHNIAYCIARNVFKKFGFDGLAQFYFHDAYMVDNFKHNSSSFHSFWTSAKVQEIKKHCEKK
ncbi:MAG TPA: hypothetical protein PLP65_06040 [Bacteroidales bacterium]|jgi:hypothetical protein|nr:hypothetical protein [Bacteroidales bacterium]HOU98388.1 hypothetical protein [Bacteroidales bacterium]